MNKIFKIEEDESQLIPIMEVAFQPPFPNPAPTDLEGELAWLDVGDLYIDKRYQRPVGPRGEKNIKQVIENFSWSLFSPLIVGRRPKGRFAVIDGQHRSIAAVTHGGIKKVPCLIINGGPSDEAKAFAVINGAVTAIMPGQLWHARLAAGDMDAIKLQRVFDNYGVSILKYSKPTSAMFKGETSSIDTLEKSFKRFGGAIFRLAVRTVMETGNGNAGFMRGTLINATCNALLANPFLLGRQEDVMRAVRTVGIKYIYQMAEMNKGQKGLPFMTAYEKEFILAMRKEIKPWPQQT